MRKQQGLGILAFLFVGAMGDSCSTAATMTLTLYFDRVCHTDPQTIGRLLAVPIAIYIICTIPMGHWGDRFGLRRFTLLGAALLAGSTGALYIVRTPADALLPLAVKGLGAAMFWPGLSGWLSRGADSVTLPRRMAAFNLGWSVGSVLGAFVAGRLYGLIGPAAAWGAYGAAMGVGLLVISLQRGPAAQVDQAARADDRPPSPAWRRRQAWLASFAAFFVINCVRNLFPIYARQRLGLSPETTGTWVAGINGVQTLVFIYLGWFRPRDADGRWVEPVQWAAVAGLLLIALGFTRLALPALLVLGLYTAVSYSASMFHSLYGREDAARQTGINEAVVGLGSVMGPWLGGSLAWHIGPSAPYGLCAAVVVIVGVLTRLERWSRSDRSC